MRHVQAEHLSRVVRWPGKEKNVQVWWELLNGYGVGWNENMSRVFSTAYPMMINQNLLDRENCTAENPFMKYKYLESIRKPS